MLLNTKIISDETEHGSVEDPLSMHRTGSNETAAVSEIPYIKEKSKHFLLAKGKFGKRTVHQMQVIYFLPDVYMSSTTYLHQ